jgi:putative endonuclease
MSGRTEGRGHNRMVGQRGEDLAARWFEDRGGRVLDRNWRCSEGELDLVVRWGAALVVVEVKTRTGTTTGHPFEAITAAKRRRLRRLAAAWSAAHPSEHGEPLRVDAVAVQLIGDTAAIDHLEAVA